MNAVPPAPSFSWQPALIALGCVLLALLGLYHETGLAMVRIWARSETFTHAFLVPPISLWLIWQKRRVLARLQPCPDFRLLIPMALLALAWLLGEMVAVNAVTQLAFTGMLILAVPMVIGIPAARAIAFPLGFLLFAVPIGEFLMPKMMEWTAVATVFGLRASGIPVYQEGLHFVIPSGRWSVVEACSGVRYLIASVVVGTLFAYLNYRSLKRRLIFVGVAILAPLIANWLRAYMIVMLGHLSGNQIAVGVDHLIYGWVFFGVVIMIMFLIGMRWSEPAHDDEDAGVAPRESASRGGCGAGRWAGGGSLLIAIAAAPHLVLWAQTSGSALPPPRLDPQLLATGGWRLSAEPLTDWQPSYQNPSGALQATLTDGARRVGVYVAYYRQQDYASKLISSENVLTRSEDKRWLLVARGAGDIRLAGETATVRQARLRSNVGLIPGESETRLVVWHWYWINGRITASDYAGKVWQALFRIAGQGDDSAAVVLYAEEGLPGGPEAALRDYIEQGGARIAALLANARAQR